jgi:PilZ domain
MGKAMPTAVVRKHTRFRRWIPVKYANEAHRGAGIMTDLSMNGSRITGETVVAVGMVLTLQIFVPGDVKPAWIERVKVLWVKGPEFGVTFEMDHYGGIEQLVLSRAIRGVH